MSVTAFATPFHYSEADSGDMPNWLPPNAPVFQFGIGNNTIAGSKFILFPAGVTWYEGDFDEFMFSIPDDTKLVSVNYQYSTTITGPMSDPALRYDLCVENPPNPGQCGNYLDTFQPHVTGSSTLPAFSAALPLGLGTYPYAVLEAGGGVYVYGPRPFGFSTDYEWTFTVLPTQALVAEPSTLALIALALVGIGFARNRNGPRAV